MLSSFGHPFNLLADSHHTTTARPGRLRTLVRACALAAVLSAGLPFSIAHADDFADVSKFIRAGQFNEAMAKVDAVLAQRPRDAQMRFLKGLILTEQNKTNEAINVFTKLTQDYPELPEPHNNLAVLYASSGQYDKARGALEAAIHTNPTYATAHENLGDVYAKLASQAYDKALQLDSANNSAKSKLTMVRTLVGNSTAAQIPKNTVAANSKPATTLIAKASTPEPKIDAKAEAVAKAEALAKQKADKLAAEQAEKTAKAEKLVAEKAVEKAEKEAKLAAEKKEKDEKIAAEKVAKAEKLAAEKAAKAEKADQAKTLAAAKAAEKAEKAEKSKSAEAKGGNERDDVLKVVNAWAKAWSAQDMKGYLNSYGNDFQTPKGESRKAWSEERRSRIEGKGHITVQIEDAQVSIAGNTATVKFRQRYVSDKLSANSRKILVLTKQGSKWQIKQERAAN